MGAKHKIKLLAILGLILSCTSVLAKPDILNHYPQCDYKVLETVTHQKKSSSQDGRLTQEFVTRAFNNIANKFIARADEIGADAILLIDRDFELNEKKNWTKSGDDHSVISYTAELIQQCHANPELALKTTPFDANGQPQKTLKLGAIGGWERQIEIVLPSNEKRLTPDIESTDVSLQSGVYGARLGDDYDLVTNLFGTPTFAMQVDDTHRLVAFGRKHWFTFKNNKLVQATTQSPWFSTELLNLLAFDDRFENLKWQIERQIGKGDAASRAASLSSIDSKDDTKIVLKKNDQELVIMLDNYHGKSGDKANRVVVGYSFQVADFIPLAIPKIDNSPEVIRRVETYLNDSERDRLTLEMLGAAPLAIAWVDSSSQLLLFGNHLLIEKTGTNLSKLFFLENAFNGANSQTNWRFNGIEQGQLLNEVLEVLGDDAFHFDDLVEFSGEAFSQNLYFYETQGDLRLLTSEVSLF